jgi:hypothetical protein
MIRSANRGGRLALVLALLCLAPMAHGAEPQGADKPPETIKPPDAEGYSELNWDALIPVDWRPDKLFEEYNVNELRDDDPRAQELMVKLKQLWKEAPVVEELDGKRVKLPGFVVPLENDGEKIHLFLLVPYFGACIHVPPPPANQTVLVSTKKGKEFEGKLFDTVWVKGTLRVEAASSEVGDAGYSLQADVVEDYEQ